VALAECVIPSLKIDQTRYFTAKVKNTVIDPKQAVKQQTYIRALLTLPNLTIHYGRYQEKRITARHCHPPPDEVKVYKNEEKATDVNIATHMLADAFRDECDQLVLMTNDSDLFEAVRLINDELNKKVIILNPHSIDTATRKNAKTGQNHKPRPSWHLAQAAFMVRDIRSDGNNCHMTNAQFPHAMTDKHGTFTIPEAWV
jgi:uncharacterized LabA/DUF88 family protein